MAEVMSHWQDAGREYGPSGWPTYPGFLPEQHCRVHRDLCSPKLLFNSTFFYQTTLDKLIPQGMVVLPDSEGQEVGKEAKKDLPSWGSLVQSRLCNMQFSVGIRGPGTERRNPGGREKSVARIRRSMSKIRERSQKTCSMEFRLAQLTQVRLINQRGAGQQLLRFQPNPLWTCFLFFWPLNGSF